MRRSSADDYREHVLGLAALRCKRIALQLPSQIEEIDGEGLALSSAMVRRSDGCDVDRRRCAARRVPSAGVVFEQ